jgi:hypothetical protein
VSRDFFGDGIFQIDASNSFSKEALFQKIKRKIDLMVQDSQELFEGL